MDINHDKKSLEVKSGLILWQELIGSHNTYSGSLSYLLFLPALGQAMVSGRKTRSAKKRPAKTRVLEKPLLSSRKGEANRHQPFFSWNQH